MPLFYSQGMYYCVGNMDNQQVSYRDNSTKKFTDVEKSWVAGFIEGEGSWNISFKFNSDSKLVFYPSPTFSITQHFQGNSVLDFCKAVFGGIGSIVPKSGSKNVLVYSVSKLDLLLTVIIPFLEQWNILSARKSELKMFIQVCNLMQQQQHLTNQGLRNIVELVFSVPLKKGGDRLYTKQQLLDVLDDRSKAQNSYTPSKAR
jgi:LAGLIDADG endonuclease